MASAQPYGITLVYFLCGLIPYATSSQFHTAASCGFHTRLRVIKMRGDIYGKKSVTCVFIKHFREHLCRTTLELLNRRLNPMAYPSLAEISLMVYNISENTGDKFS